MFGPLRRRSGDGDEIFYASFTQEKPEDPA
jgi:hypothetical protein